MSKNPIESKIESYFKQQIKNVGGLAFKFKSTVNGVPDQIVIYNGEIHFVEIKRPGEEPRANQVLIHSQINKQGVPVYTVDTTKEVDSFIKKVLKAEIIKEKQSTVKPVVKSKNAFKLN